MLSEEGERIMEQVVRGELSRENIPHLKSRQLRVSAAVAYILLHPRGYIDSENRILRAYNEILEELTGERFVGGTLVSVSRTLGLHVSASPLETGVHIPRLGRIVTLTPPLKIQYLAHPEVTAADQERAEEIVRQLITKDGAGTAKAVYELLNAAFGK